MSAIPIDCAEAKQMFKLMVTTIILWLLHQRNTKNRLYTLMFCNIRLKLDVFTTLLLHTCVTFPHELSRMNFPNFRKLSPSYDGRQYYSSERQDMVKLRIGLW